MSPPRRKVRPPNWVDVSVAHRGGAECEEALQRAAQQFLKVLALDGCELSISLVSDGAIRRLNRTWRGKDKATDVLSFPAGEQPAGTPGPRPLGDVVLSLDTAARRAKEFAWPVQHELLRYLAHGLLHLLGHDHQKPAEARKMRAEEKRLLGERGML